MVGRLLAIVAVAFVCLASTASGGVGSLDRRLAGTLKTPGVVAAASTAMVLELPTGRVVFARNPDLSLEPASNEKLGVTFAALADLGPGYRFPTQVLGEGHRDGSTWVGRLVLKGFGDPALTSADLRRLANIVWRLGIRRVTGGIVGDESYFDTDRVAPGWLASFAGIESPPLSALIVDRGARNNRLVADPALAATARFDRLLHVRGIAALGPSKARAWPRARPIATIYSPPLWEVLQFMDHTSDNFTAEMVMKTLGAKFGGAGTTAAGAAVTTRALAAAGVPLAGVRIADGSGLSRDDRVTARELATILLRIWNNGDMRSVVWDALPVAGELGTTLQNRLPDNPDRTLLRGKTGTTDIASALSGYVGKRYAFVTIENGDPVDYWAAHTAEDGVVNALIDQINVG